MKKLLILFVAFLIIIGINELVAFTPNQTMPEKKALAILGDSWHCTAPLYKSIVLKLDKSKEPSVRVIPT